jgi:anthranilate phosphoribosyltransferase
VTLMNAGAGIYAAEAAGSIAEGVDVARTAIDSGQAMERLQHLVALSQKLGAEEEAARSSNA